MSVAGVCRLCARPGATISLFRFGCPNLSTQAMSCASIMICPGDGLPEVVCENCSCQLSASYQFKLQCEDSDRSFRTLLAIACGNVVKTEELNKDSLPFEIKQETTHDDSAVKSLDALSDDSLNAILPLDSQEDTSENENLFKNNKRSKSADNKPRKKSTENKKRSSVEDIEMVNSDDSTSPKAYYPKLRIRRESLIADKSHTTHSVNRNNSKDDYLNLDMDVCSRLEVTLSFDDSVCIPPDSEEKINKSEHRTKKYKGNLRRLKEPCSQRKFKSRLKKKFQEEGLLKLLKLPSNDLADKTSENLDDNSIEKLNRKFMCDKCGQRYKQLNVLLQHQSTHLDIKLFSCTICDKRFTRGSHLTAHMRIHNNIKPYICETCGLSFVKSSDLSRHRRIHSDERNYSCPLCPRRFKRSGDVTSHMRSHTGDRPYKCETCCKSYSSHSSLQKHKKGKCKPTTNMEPKTEVQM